VYYSIGFDLVCVFPTVLCKYCQCITTSNLTIAFVMLSCYESRSDRLRPRCHFDNYILPTCINIASIASLSLIELCLICLMSATLCLVNYAYCVITNDIYKQNTSTSSSGGKFFARKNNICIRKSSVVNFVFSRYTHTIRLRAEFKTAVFLFSSKHFRYVLTNRKILLRRNYGREMEINTIRRRLNNSLAVFAWHVG